MRSVDECWEFLEARVGGPAALPRGATTGEISEAEAIMRVVFPDALRRLLHRHDGSGSHFISPYKMGGGGQSFMSIKEIISTWETMVAIGAEFEEGGEFGEQSGPIKRSYWNKRWVPFTDNGCGDNIFLDLDPGEGGTVGQVVDWWHEGGGSTFQSRGLLEWMNEVVDEIKKGVYTFASA